MPIERTEKFIRVRVKMSGDFEKGSFKTITISEKEGIKSVIGRLKGKTTTSTQAYLFDLKKGWTESKAAKWVKDHGHKILSTKIINVKFQEITQSSNIYMSDDGKLHVLVNLPTDIDLSEDGKSNVRALYFKGKEQIFKHWSGEFKLNAEIFKNMLNNFNKKVVGRDLYVNYDHEPTRSTKAAGWINEMKFDEDTGSLNLDVEWNPAGSESIRNKEYKYFSSEFVLGQFQNSETGKIYNDVFTGGALTNNPFLRKTVVNLSDDFEEEEESISFTKEVKSMEEINLKDAKRYLLEEHQINVDELIASQKELASLKETVKVKDEEIKDVKAKFDDYVKIQDELKIEQLLEDGTKEGKITQANREANKIAFSAMGFDKAKDYLKSLPQIVKLEQKGSSSAEGPEDEDDKENEEVKKIAKEKEVSMSDAYTIYLQRKGEEINKKLLAKEGV